MTIQNIAVQTDFYKQSHYAQYPDGTTKVFSYVEARGGKYDANVFFGLQAYIKQYLTMPVTKQMVDQAEQITNNHVGPGVFNREGWDYIVNELNGKLPLSIKAVAEGTVVPVSNVLMTIENTDPNCFWLTSFVETSILRGIWYATTVATNSWSIKQVIKGWMDKTSDVPDEIAFSLNDFGSRGVSSGESAGIGGMAHLVNFEGTDNIEGSIYADMFYGAGTVGFSIAAMEHSTVTIFGKENEAEAFRQMMKRFGGEGKMVACVSDSYDIYNAVENIWGGELKQEVIDMGGRVVIRPDSGEIVEVVINILNILDRKFGTTTNNKGYRVLPPYIRVIQGDGVNQDSINLVLQKMQEEGFSAENVVFGSGGALLQQLDRDTSKFALKCSMAIVNGEEIDVFKDPVTDTGKRSKKGEITLVKNDFGDFRTVRVTEVGDQEVMLQEVYRDGKLLIDQSFEEIRNNVVDIN
jgi:nicotinamide phosphoribosyltransferase